jgi:glycosyltransferase involved in cell wall biosynthesis
MVLMASRLLWEKGVGEFVEAARLLKRRGSRARFAIAGAPAEGHPTSVPRATLERWKREGDVEWLGWSRDVPDLLARSHIVALPSYYGEGIPRILIEAAASGRPIVTTSSPGCREAVAPGVTGLLVPPRDAVSLAGAIETLLSDAPLRARMGRNGRALAARHFSTRRVLEANLDLHREALAELQRSLGLRFRAAEGSRG